jgi:protein TonB
MLYCYKWLSLAMTSWQRPKTTNHSDLPSPHSQPDHVDLARSQLDFRDGLAGHGNIVPFMRPPPDAAMRSAPIVAAMPQHSPPRSAPALLARMSYAGLLIGSLAAHAALLAFLNREAAPTASIGEEVISVEIVVGANTQAGIAERPSEAETDNRVAAQEPKEDKPEVKSPEPETPLVRDVAEQPPPVSESVPEEIPAAVVVKNEIRDDVKPVERPVELQALTPPRETARPESRTSRAPPVASQGVGRGRSDNDANYSARVAAHLARFKRFPSEARSQRRQGRTMVSFQLDGSGRVASVRLVRGSGVTALDQGAVAMVHRASPFPAPPDRRPRSFTAPVNFQLN